MKPKFNVGDVVIVACDDNSVYGKCKYRGETHTIVEVNANLPYMYKLNHVRDYRWRDSELREAAAQSEIVVVGDGFHIVTATLYEDGKAVKTAEAKCCPEDKFDFMVGANLAMSRLTEAVKKSKYYSGKMVCVKSEFPEHWTVGKVYTVVEGTVRDNTSERGFIVKSEKDALHMGSTLNNFIPLVED